MTICAYFLKGNCRYGNTCKYEHSQGDNKNQLLGPESFSAVAKTMQEDLTKEKPVYYLSVYSPQKSCLNMIDDTDVSPEELRFQAYQAKANNTVAQYIAHESQLLQKMDSAILLVNSSPIESYKHFYHTKMALNHPNSTFRKATPASAFGGSAFGTSNSTPAFGQPTSAFGAPTMSAFGAFSQQAPTATVSAFGQPSPVRSGVSAFGQPQSPFGATQAQPNTVTAFGNPSPFGSPAPAASAFGAKPTASAFGQPSRFGTTSAFGTTTPTKPMGASVFGSPSVFGVNTQANNTNAFGQSAFGQTSLNNSTTTAFGQAASINPTSAFGQAASNAPTSAFGQAASNAPTSAFGQPSPFGQPVATTAFGQPSAFGQSAFGKPTGFGAAAINPSSAAKSSAFGQTNTGGPVSAFGQAASAFSQPSSNVGFAAFAGGNSTPNDLGMGSTTLPEQSEPIKPQAPNFQPPTTTVPLSSSAFQSSTKTQNSSHQSGNNDAKLIEKLKSLDPFWEDSPRESDLPPDILQAFKAQSFSWGSIPNVPPPITLL